MIEPKELRIGNWVDDQDEGMVRVEGVKEGSMYKEILIHGCWIALESVDPIPLTEEWLERFGFEKESDSQSTWWIKGFEYPMGITMNGFNGSNIEDDTSWSVSMDTGYWSQPVTVVKKHVHQLQNLFCCLTGKELELKS